MEALRVVRAANGEWWIFAAENLLRKGKKYDTFSCHDGHDFRNFRVAKRTDEICIVGADCAYIPAEVENGWYFVRTRISGQMWNEAIVRKVTDLK
jgi:hypothetical protein